MTDINKAELYELLPHRPPMLLIDEIIAVDQRSSKAIVYINEQASFYEPGLGVPAWIGIEYMGQTAALIAGYQLKQGLVEPHLGFLLGTRHYNSHCDYFSEQSKLLITCEEKALVGDSLATFDCSICYYGQSDQLATANLSVFRKQE